MAEADVIFVNGLGFETWSDTLIKESGTKATIHVATEGIEPLEVEGEIDPHAFALEYRPGERMGPRLARRLPPGFLGELPARGLLGRLGAC